VNLKAPVAWAVMSDQGVVCDIRVTNPPYMQPMVTGMQTMIPLHLSPTLTEAEREAVQRSIFVVERWHENGGYHTSLEEDIALLRNLSERTK
jgi:hypothetical protein